MLVIILSHPLTNCNICNDPIAVGQEYIIDFWDNSFHHYHLKEYAQCYSCNRLIAPQICGISVHKKGGDQYFDGRWICNVCIKKGELVFLPSDSELILEELLNLANTKGVRIPRIFEIELVFKDNLATIRKSNLRKGEKNPALTSIRLTRKVFDQYVNLDTKCTVYVLNGLHKLLFKKCLAHEIMHVWIAVNCGYQLEPIYEEGLCNYFAYELLKEMPESDYKRFYLRLIENNPDPVYGDGFRKVRDIAEEFADFKDLLLFIQYNPSVFKK